MEAFTEASTEAFMEDSMESMEASTEAFMNFHGIDGSFHGSFHELPREKQVVPETGQHGQSTFRFHSVKVTMVLCARCPRSSHTPRTYYSLLLLLLPLLLVLSH